MEGKLLITEMSTERLMLRKMEAADSSALFALWSDPQVTRFMNIDPFTSEAQAKEIIQLFDRLHRNRQAIRYSIFIRETKELIGSCGFNYVDSENAKAEIAYDLSRHFWGCGFGSEAVAALLHQAFYGMGLNRIEAKVDPLNKNSIHLLKKLNFHFEGTQRQSEKINQQFFYVNMYSKLKSD